MWLNHQMFFAIINRCTIPFTTLWSLERLSESIKYFKEDIRIVPYTTDYITIIPIQLVALLSIWGRMNSWVLIFLRVVSNPVPNKGFSCAASVPGVAKLTPYDCIHVDLCHGLQSYSKHNTSQSQRIFWDLIAIQSVIRYPLKVNVFENWTVQFS